MTNERREVRVLYISSMVVTPATGGGNASYNLLEPHPEGAEIFYASLMSYTQQQPRFPDLEGRTRAYPGECLLLAPALREGRLRKSARDLKNTLRLSGAANRLNVRNKKDELTAWLLRQVEELRPDALMLCPQPVLDSVVCNEVMDKTRLPAVAWFMDDYYKDRFSRVNVKRLWNRAHSRFVISESMGEAFSRLYGGDYEVLAHSIDYPGEYTPPAESPEGRLRILYAGSVNQYYTPTMKLALREFAGLGDRVTLDIYTGDDLPDGGYGDAEVSWRKFPLIKSGNLVQRLREYDVLLLLSNFERKWSVTAETAQASKLAEYMASGRCILAYGPPYAENVRYIERHDIGETVTSDEPGALRNAVLGLAQDPGRRRSLGEAAYLFGREHRDRAKNRDRLWRALLDAARARAGG